MTTPTTDPFEVLAAVLRHDFGTYDKLAAQVDPNELGVALGTTFFLTADRRFADGTVADVIDFVARARRQFDDTGDNLDPQAAERLIRAAAFDEEELASGIDQHQLGRLQTVLLTAMVDEADWNEQEVADLLNEARSIMAARS